MATQIVLGAESPEMASAMESKFATPPMGVLKLTVLAGCCDLVEQRTKRNRKIIKQILFIRESSIFSNVIWRLLHLRVFANLSVN